MPIGTGNPASKWYKSTFETVEESMDYHSKTHGNGRTLEQYTDDAMNFFNKNKNIGTEVTLKDGTQQAVEKS